MTRYAPGLSPLMLILWLCAPSALLACESLDTGTAGLVTDQRSGLLWRRCAIGQNGDQCTGKATALSWVDALNRARSERFAGISRWRLPKIEQLETLFERRPECIASVFPGIGSSVIWSASANLDYATDAWAYGVETRQRRVFARDSRQRVLLVAVPN